MAKFSRGAYQFIASTFRTCYAIEASYRERQSAVYFAAGEMARRLKGDNPIFDADHFLAVVRGEREIDSRPPRSSTQRCKVDRCHHLCVPGKDVCDVHLEA